MPPPPPPPAPPPIPKQALGGLSKSNNFEPPVDRNALLSQIRKGTRLKKAETNDRSGPSIEGKSSNASSNGTSKLSLGSKSNGPFPIIPPGGLFAQGIPKLRPTGPRFDGSSQSSSKIQSLKTVNSTASSLDHLRIGQLSGSRSQPPSPVSKPRMMMTSGPSSLRTESSGNPHFPDDITIKGPAPAPPPASQKPVFKTNGEQVPNKPTVKRSASQTNLGQRPRLTRPPPNVKPPPPPKTATPTPPSTAPPPPPSKPPNILRRQSFGVGESHSSRLVANKLSVASEASKPVPKTIGAPPPPPRNNSAPNDLNKIVGNSSSPNVPNHVSKMNIAPPPPPPNRVGIAPSRGGPIRPPPPRAPAPPPPPPPPQHQFNSLPAPPSQLKATASANMAPPPPARVSSMKHIPNFEERFNFHLVQSLPQPERYMNIQKSYPSKANRQKQNTRRLPPPPPPQPSTTPDPNRGQSFLHIQLNPGKFSNSYAHS